MDCPTDLEGVDAQIAALQAVSGSELTAEQRRERADAITRLGMLRGMMMAARDVPKLH